MVNETWAKMGTEGGLAFHLFDTLDSRFKEKLCCNGCCVTSDECLDSNTPLLPSFNECENQQRSTHVGVKVKKTDSGQITKFAGRSGQSVLDCAYFTWGPMTQGRYVIQNRLSMTGSCISKPDAPITWKGLLVSSFKKKIGSGFMKMALGF